MKAKIFGSMIKEYEDKSAQWFTENKDLDIKHVAIAVGPSGEWLLAEADSKD